MGTVSEPFFILFLPFSLSSSLSISLSLLSVYISSITLKFNEEYSMGIDTDKDFFLPPPV